MKKLIPIILFSLLSGIAGFAQKSRFKMTIVKPTVPKPKKPAPPADSSWFITYEMTILGSGSQKDEDDPGNETIWSIDRKYEGTYELDLHTPGIISTDGLEEKETLSSIRSGRITDWTWRFKIGKKVVRSSIASGALPIHVIIHDKLEIRTHEKGEGSSFENTTTLKKWQVDLDDGYTSNELKLRIIKKPAEYNVWIPLKAVDDVLGEGSVKLTTTISNERSREGYGGLPTSETKNEPEQNIHISTIKIPEVNGLLEKGIIHPFTDMPIPEKNGGFESDWPDVEPDEAMIPGIPETKTKVAIHIFYRFSHQPILKK